MRKLEARMKDKMNSEIIRLEEPVAERTLRTTTYTSIWITL
jgi:hypothetical protein